VRQFVNWALIVGGALLVLLEVVLGGFAGFDLVLLGSALVLGGGLGLVWSSTAIGLVVSSVLCLLYIAVGRRYVRRHMQHRETPSNADALLGRSAVITVRVAEHAPGQAKVGDEVWRAALAPGVPGPLEPGTVVSVAGVDGVTLQVR
jgi:membrane protein implicated in regulation of membrane protease activity